jgi:hypothetical protein
MFLSAYENDAWKNAALDWVEEKQDGAVEVVATRADGTTLALEHTLIQPFVGEKFDSERFMKAFARIEKNPALVVPARSLDVIIPVGASSLGDCPLGICRARNLKDDRARLVGQA